MTDSNDHVPDQVLTPPSAQAELERIEADLMAGHAEGYEWVAGIDASALKRHREAVEAAIRAPLEAENARLRQVLERIASHGHAVSRCRANTEAAIMCQEGHHVAIENAAAALAGVPKAPVSDYIDIVFDGPPSHESGRFVEVESPTGTSIRMGEWIQDGELWRLRIPRAGVPKEAGGE